MWYWPCGFVSARCGTRAADPVEVVELELDPGLVGDGQQVEHGVGRAAERHDDGDGVLEGLLGHDLAGPDPGLEQLDHGPTGLVGEVVAPAVDGRRAELPGSDMPIASATDAIVLAVNMPAHDPSVGQALCSIRLSSSSLERADGVGADGLEDADDVERPVAEAAGQDRAAVEEDRSAG